MLLKKIVSVHSLEKNVICYPPNKVFSQICSQGFQSRQLKSQMPEAKTSCSLPQKALLSKGWKQSSKINKTTNTINFFILLAVLLALGFYNISIINLFHLKGGITMSKDQLA